MKIGAYSQCHMHFFIVIFLKFSKTLSFKVEEKSFENNPVQNVKKMIITFCHLFIRFYGPNRSISQTLKHSQLPNYYKEPIALENLYI